MTEELLGVDAVDALTALGVGRGHLVHHGELRPRVAQRIACLGRPRHDLELSDRRRSLAVRGAETVGTGVTAADDHDVLAVDVDRRVLEVAELHPVGERQVLHRLVDTVESRPGIGRSRHWVGAARQHDRVVRRAQHLDVDVAADDGVGAELGPLRLHLREAPVEVALLHLELGDAVAQQAADTIGPLEHHHLVPGPGQLLGGGQAGRARADHGHPLAGAHRRAPVG